MKIKLLDVVVVKSYSASFSCDCQIRVLFKFHELVRGEALIIDAYI